MFLVPQHQLDMLKQQQQQQQQQQQYQDQNTASIRQVVQNDLDRAMSDILKLPDTDVYEKAKKYSQVLQRYLALVRQGEREKTVLTLSMPDTEIRPEDRRPDDDDDDDDGHKKDTVLEGVLKHIPKRSQRNAEYILDAITRSKHVLSWTDNAEIVVNGRPLHGTHLYDLVKSVTASHNISDISRPLGWDVFLKTLAHLNIPLMAIPNKQVRGDIAEYKRIGDAPSFSSHKSKGKKRSVIDSQGYFSTPLRTLASTRSPPHRLNTSQWEDF